MNFSRRRKVFWSYWHSGFLFKMSQIKILMGLIKIIESFLSQKSFSGKIGNIVSTARKIEAGIPQIFCLSQLLIIITRYSPHWQSENFILRRGQNFSHKNQKRGNIQLIYIFYNKIYKFITILFMYIYFIIYKNVCSVFESKSLVE